MKFINLFIGSIYFPSCPPAGWPRSISSGARLSRASWASPHSALFLLTLQPVSSQSLRLQDLWVTPFCLSVASLRFSSMSLASCSLVSQLTCLPAPVLWSLCTTALCLDFWFVFSGLLTKRGECACWVGSKSVSFASNWVSARSVKNPIAVVS